MDVKILQACPLFDGVDASDLETVLTCLSAQEKSFGKGDFIFHAGDSPLSVGIVLSGAVHVIQEDYWGNRTIVSRIDEAGMFAEAFACSDVTRLPVSVVSVQPTQALFIDCKKIITTCSSACDFHLILIKNMLRILANKNVFLTQKTEHITKRSIRDKVLSYLSSRAVLSNSKTITVPFNRQELADYLSVDRSALSRELGAMQAEGLIRFQGQNFELL